MGILPETIKDKIREMNGLIDKARDIKAEVEEWCARYGGNPYSAEWNGAVYDDCNSVSGFDEDGLESQMEKSMRRIY